MSRLDDELRKAFKREQPSMDFTTRLLERVALQPPPKPRWWQRLAVLLEPPKLRWVAIGVTASLLIAIGAAQYSRMHQVTVSDDSQVSKGQESPAPENKPAINDSGSHKQELAVTNPNVPAMNKRPRASSFNRVRLARLQKEKELRAEGEAAKETLMFALSIATSALSDAQKAVNNEGLNP
jgi:hypothetical protein